MISNLKFRVEYPGIIAVGKRNGLLARVIKEYKYGPVRALARPLAELLAQSLDDLTGEVVVVPLPTVVQHIRQRGFDHTLLIGKEIARIKGWKCEKVLKRSNKAVQVGQNRETRLRQAKEAYLTEQALDETKTYLLIDDVWTTGASMRAAKKVLIQKGARRIKLAVLAISND